MKAKRFIPSLIFTSLVLTGCALSTTLEFEEYGYDIKEVETKKEVTAENYYSFSNFSSLSYEKYDKTQGFIENFRDLYSSTNNGRSYLNAPSVGEQKILVIPVSFKDSNKEELDKKKILIENAFFGSESKNSFYSVAEYFDISSYGHLKIKGEVTDFYHLDMTARELQTSISSRTSSSRYVTALAMEWYQESHEDISDYDSDDDGYIDSVFVVYDHEFDNTTDSLFWAYVDHMNKGESVSFIGSSEKVIINNTPGNKYVSTYAWASLDFLYPKKNKVDAHVFIHESGHLFGLVDYYSNSYYQPLGYLDMMDYNLGDHNIYSKMLLNWLTPKVLSGEGKITLKPSNTSGECILIPAGSYNGTAYDEYLLLEYYSPTGINKKDGELSFQYVDGQGNQRKGRLFTQYGLKVYHVDSRLAYFKNKGLNSIICLLDDPDYETKLQNYRDNNINSYCIDFAYDNDNYLHPLIALLEAGEITNIKDGLSASNESLFQKGDSFGIDAYKDFKFYNGEELEYAFEVESLNPNGITLNFIQK